MSKLYAKILLLILITLTTLKDLFANNSSDFDRYELTGDTTTPFFYDYSKEFFVNVFLIIALPIVIIAIVLIGIYIKLKKKKAKNINSKLLKQDENS